MKMKVMAENVWNIIYPVFIAIGISIICSTVWSTIMTGALLNSGDYGSEQELMQKLQELSIENALMLTLISSLITIPVIIFFRRRDMNKDKKNGLYVKYQPVFFLKYMLIIPFGIFSMMAGNYFTSILTMLMPESMLSTYDYAQEAIYGSSLALQVIAAAIVGPVVEELIFRGLIYNRMKKMTSMMWAAILSSVIFGIYHGNWVQAPYAIIIGLVCVYVYEKYKSIIAPILLHMSANMFSVILSAIAMAGAGEAVDTPSFSEQFTALITMTLLTGCFAGLLGIIIHKTVKAKEVKE